MGATELGVKVLCCLGNYHRTFYMRVGGARGANSGGILCYFRARSIIIEASYTIRGDNLRFFNCKPIYFMTLKPQD